MNFIVFLWIIVSIYLVVSYRGVIKKKNLWIENLHVEQKQNREDLRLVQDITENLTGEVYQLIQKNAQLSEEIKNVSNKLESNRKTINELYGKLATEDEKIGLLIEEIKDLKKRNEYLKAVKNHKKRPVEKVKETGEWECVAPYLEHFTKGVKYKSSNKSAEVGLIWMQSYGKDYLVAKSHFKPVQS